MLDDVRFGWRKLRQEPSFTAIAVLTLALGIGATSAVFSLVQGVLLTPPPYREPEQLVLVHARAPTGKPARRSDGPPRSGRNGSAIRSRSRRSPGTPGPSTSWSPTKAASRSKACSSARTSSRCSDWSPCSGCTFSESETAFPAGQVIVLGYDVWQRKFGGDPKIVGTPVRISRRETPPTVIGVMPPGIRFLPSPTTAQEPNYNVNAQVDFWMPAAPNPERLKQPNWDVVGRLRSGATIDQARAELTVLTARQAQADKDFDGYHARRPAAHRRLQSRRRTHPAAAVRRGGAGAVDRLRQRRRPAARPRPAASGRIRRPHRARRQTARALPSGLGREPAASPCSAARSASALAFGIIKVFKLIAGPAIPRLDAVTAVWPVLASGSASRSWAALVAGFLPAFRASRLDAMQVIKSAGPKSSAGRRERRLLRAVTIVQTALTLALLVGAGLLLRTTSNLSRVQSGYSIDQILTMTVTAVQGDWKNFHTLALERVSPLPGVQQAAFAWGVPLTGNNWPGRVEIEGQPPIARPSDAVALPLRSVTPGYFDLLRIPLTEGRDFRVRRDTRQGRAQSRHRQSRARRPVLPRHQPIGKKLWQGSRSSRRLEIVGVVANSRTDDLTRAAEPELYLSLWQAGAFSKDLVVRTTATRAC